MLFDFVTCLAMSHVVMRCVHPSRAMLGIHVHKVQSVHHEKSWTEVLASPVLWAACQSSHTRRYSCIHVYFHVIHMIQTFFLNILNHFMFQMFQMFRRFGELVTPPVDFGLRRQRLKLSIAPQSPHSHRTENFLKFSHSTWDKWDKDMTSCGWTRTMGTNQSRLTSTSKMWNLTRIQPMQTIPQRPQMSPWRRVKHFFHKPAQMKQWNTQKTKTVWKHSC